MDLEALAHEIKDLNYVVMRNWETMPPDGDIDFFVSKEDEGELRAICEIRLGDPKWYDVRSPGDGYFPVAIERELLDGRLKYDGFWIPNRGVHFVSLMYHQLVHKGDHRYQPLLDKLFLLESGVVKPSDPGVGFHPPQ